MALSAKKLPPLQQIKKLDKQSRMDVKPAQDAVSLVGFYEQIQRYFENKQNNSLDFFDIPLQYQNSRDRHVYRSIHANSKASKVDHRHQDIVKRFYDDKLSAKEQMAYRILKKSKSHSHLMSEL